ncbi:MAG: sigma 54-interacting transcriptional regulator [Deltaproteobacteria bacterium]|nr:sigma 54-interacting transcriptional regulator [Deltaproteobacteria bacterium]
MQNKDWRQRFADTAELLPVIICEVDRAFQITYVNETGYRVTGYSNEDFAKGVGLNQLIPPEDAAKAGGNLQKILAGETVGSQEYRIIHKDGTLGEYQMNSAPIFQDGAVVGIRSTLTDVRERNRIRRELQQSEEKFRRIFYQSPIAVAIFDDDGILIDSNGAFQRILPAIQYRHVSVQLEALLPISTEGRAVLNRGAVLKGEQRFDTENREKHTLLMEWSLTPLGAIGGAQHYLLQMLDVTAQRLKEEEDRKVIAHLRQEAAGNYTFGNLVTRSPRMKQIFQMLGPVADANTNVLINGESGTGKEMIARAIHANGNRSDKPFVAFNCSALPDNLIESELFGYLAGAFTDAKKNKPGKFSLADGGVVFLDEIGDISGAMQAKLLRVLQEKTFEPLGATQSVKVDVRVIAATNRNLQEMVYKGEFREDLFYRLNVVRIPLPPLRERTMDIPALCEHFISRFNRIFNKNIKGFTGAAMNVLMSNPFPGNIRQLENTVEHSFVFCNETHIDVRHLPDEVGGVPATAGSELLTRFSSFEELEASYLKAIITDCNGSKIKAARRLGVHKTTLFRKLKKYQLE